MNKLLTFIAAIALTGSAVVAQQNNNLVMFSENGEKFYLILNGVRQNSIGQTNVKVTGLNNPNYKAKVIFENKSIPDLDQNIYMMYGGETVSNHEITCSISKTKKGYKIKLVSAAPLASVQPNPDQHVVTYTTGQPSDMGSTTTTTTTGGGTGNVNVTSTGGSTTTGTGGGGSTSTTTTTTTTGTGTGTVGMNVGVNGGGTGFNMNVTVSDGTGGTTTTQQTTTTTTSTTTTGGSTGSTTTTTGTGTNGNMNVNVTTTGTGMDGGVNMNTSVTGTGTNSGTNTNTNNTNTNMGGTGSGCTWAMSPTDFEDAKKSVSKQTFADKKLTIAKQVADNNCLNADQVKQLLKLFDFEANKLDFAKYAYKKTLDRNNYYKVNDVFDFSSSVDELDEYIKTVK